MEVTNLVINNKKHKAFSYGKKDYKQIKLIIDTLRQLNEYIHQIYPLARDVNLPETVSQVLLCIYKNLYMVEGIKGDCWDASINKIIECKASSAEKDLTSFSPNDSYYEKYFIDCKNLLSKYSYSIYKLPNNLDEVFVNKKETFGDHRKQGRRPRFSIKDKLIKTNKLEVLHAETII